MAGGGGGGGNCSGSISIFSFQINVFIKSQLCVKACSSSHRTCPGSHRTLSESKQLRLARALSALFLLFPGDHVASASRKRGGGGGGKSDDMIVGLLVCTLLLLLILLFLVWRHLSHASEGKYHPRRLMRGLVVRLQEFRERTRSEELSQGYPDERDSDGEIGEQQEDDTEDEGDDGEREQQQQQQPQPQQEEQLSPQADDEVEVVAVEERREMLNARAEPEPTEKEAAQEPLKEDEPSGAVEGKAAVLLSDLHSFSGTAAWEDSSQQAHGTAL